MSRFLILVALLLGVLLLAGCPYVPPPAVALPPAAAPAVAPVVDDLGIAWGPAGVAPQSIPEAIAAMQLDQNTAAYLSVQNPAVGDDRVIGWIVGSNSSESKGVQMVIGRLPAGTCVDYDHGSSSVNGMVFGPVQFTDRWSRVLMNGEGSARGLKFTIWWTPCDGMQSAALHQIGEAVVATVQSTVVAPAAQPTVVAPEPTKVATNPCPVTPAAAAALIGGAAGSWNLEPGSGGTGWHYEGEVVEIQGPSFGRIDFPAGELRNGQKALVTIATFWCNG